MFVKATPSELDTIERIIEVLNETAPQIHIKAKFVEVPKNGLARPQLSSNVVSGPLTGILSEAEFRTTLRTLEQHNGVEMLAEPECVTTSGRQTRMCAKFVANTLTYFDFQEISSNLSFGGAYVGNGGSMDVIPSVLADGSTINLRIIAPVVTSLGSNKPPTIPGITGVVQIQGPLPEFRVQLADMTVTLQDGQTLVLKDLRPEFARGLFVGAYFQNPNEPNYFQNEETKKRTAHKELLVFITATIVDSAGKPVHSEDQVPFNPNTIPPPPH